MYPIFPIFIYMYVLLNSLPNDKILDQFKFKVLADDKLKVIQMAKFVLVTSIFSSDEHEVLMVSYLIVLCTLWRPHFQSDPHET